MSRVKDHPGTSTGEGSQSSDAKEKGGTWDEKKAQKTKEKERNSPDWPLIKDTGGEKGVK